MTDQQEIDFSPLSITGQKWWQSHGLKKSFSVATIIYGFLIIIASRSGMSYSDSLNFYPMVTTVYILTLVSTLVVVTTNSDKKRTLTRLANFAAANNFPLEIYINEKSGITEGKDVKTNSMLLEVLHETLRGSGQNNKLWELRGEHNGISFKLYTLLLAIRFVGGAPHWYHAGVIEVVSTHSISPVLALSKHDWLSSYLPLSEMTRRGLNKTGTLYGENSNELFTIFKSDDSSAVEMRQLEKISHDLKSSKRSIEFTSNEIFLIKHGGLAIEEKEMKQSFELIEEVTKLYRAQ